MENKRILHYEHRSQPLLPRRQFILRVLSHLGLGTALIGLSLGIGMLGYRFLEGMSWVDALLNASMILGGMGPVNPLTTQVGKVFASLYALFSGIVFLVAAGLFVAPVVHRLLHKMHMDEEH